MQHLLMYEHACDVWALAGCGMQSRDAEEAATPDGEAEPSGFLDSLLESSYQLQRPGEVPDQDSRPRPCASRRTDARYCVSRRISACGYLGMWICCTVAHAMHAGLAHGDLRHETEGWRCLESSVRALVEIMDACGPAFLPLLTPDLRQLLYRVVLHRSR